MSAIELDGAFNVRDLGGLRTLQGGRTRRGVFFRGDSLDAISEGDENLLFSKLNIGVVVDVRSQREIAYPKWRDSSVRYYNFALVDDNDIGKQSFQDVSPGELAELYFDDLRQGAPAVRATLEVIAAHLSAGIPCIIHCAAGRDRTGALVAALLAALDVCDEDIARDYTQSNRHAGDVARRLAENQLYDNGQTKNMKPAMVNADTIAELLALLRRAYGTPARFLIESGLPATVLTRLDMALVEYPRA